MKRHTDPLPKPTGDAKPRANDDERVRAAWRALENVTDPEIPVLNVVDMGIVADIQVKQDGILVEMTPTFAGCPALEWIRQGMKEAVEAIGEDKVEVKTVYDPPWTSDRLSEVGRRTLKEFGIAPPGQGCTASGETPSADATPCPHCDSSNTQLESIFGPTLCRSIHYCHSCRQSFEQFKTVQLGNA